MQLTGLGLRRWSRIVVVALAAVALMVGFAELAVRRFAPRMPPGMFLADAALGFRLAPNYRGEQVTKTSAIPLAFNSWGLRDHEYGPRPEGGCRIYVLGDSFIFGHQVASDESFAKVLERLLQQRLGAHQVEVVNGGVPRYGTLQELGLFKRTVDAVKPDVVLLGLFVGNDVLDNLEFAARHDGHREVTQGAGLVAWLRLHSQLYVWVRQRHHAANRRRQTLERQALDTHAAAPPADMERGLALTEDAVVRLARAARNHGARFAVVLVPSAPQVHPALWQAALARHQLPPTAYAADQPNVRLSTFARREGIALLDLLPVLQAHQQETLYFTLHWNPRGHAVAAEAAARFLLETGLVGTPGTPSATAASEAQT